MFSSSSVPRRLPALLALLAAAGCASSVMAQVPTLIDVNPYSTSAADSSPANFATIGNSVVFAANDGANGNELWISDSTTGGTTLLKDINPGSGSSNPTSFMEFGSRVLFAANNGANGTELWITDGTLAGTQLLVDINPGSGSAGIGSTFAVVGTFGTPGSYVVFGANNGSTGSEPWASDGTAAGTIPLADIRAGSSGSNASGFAADSSGRVYFLANDFGALGNEQWRTDGTPAGTVNITDLAPGSASSAFNASIVVDGWIYDSGTDGTTGQEPWAQDSNNLTDLRMLADLSPGSGSSTGSEWVNIGSDVYFRATGGGDTQLYKVTFDGMNDPIGVMVVADINPGGSDNVANIIVFNNELYFAATDGVNGRELWKSDGTALGTVLVADINLGSGDSTPTPLTVINGRMVFSADNGADGRELYSTDGTGPGTVKLAEIRDGAASGIGLPTHFGVANGSLMFAGRGTAIGAELYATDGSLGGTTLVKDIRPQTGNAASSPTNLATAGGRLYFSATDEVFGREPWVYDPNTSSADVILNIRSGTASSDPANFVAFGTSVVFTASPGTSENPNTEFYRAEGTTGGLIVDLNPGTGSGVLSSTVPYATLGSNLYFPANAGGGLGTELYGYDGTSISLVADANPGTLSFSPSGLTTIGSFIYMSGTTAATGSEPHRFDGTTISLLDEVIIATTGSSPRSFVEIGSTLFFVGTAAGSGTELLSYDGLDADIHTDINFGGPSSSPTNLIDFGGTLHFLANGGAGVELYQATATLGSAMPISAFPGTGVSGLIRSGDHLFLRGDNGSSDTELFVYDGATLSQLVDINPTGGAAPDNLTDVNGVVYFTATDGVNGVELYRVTYTGGGVPNGVEMVADLNAGSASSSPASLTLVGDRLFFTADDGINGRELWALNLDTSVPCVGDHNGDNAVDLADLISFNTLWQPNIGLSVPPGTQGDYNGDGAVDLADLIGFNTDWQPNIGVPCP